MPSDTLAAKGPSRLIYPKLTDPVSSADLHRLFTPSYQERKWAPTVARTPSSQVALLVQLKMFQTLGRFLRVEQIPRAVLEHVAHELGVAAEGALVYSDSTLYRHHSAVLEHLSVTSWGAAARHLARRTMIRIAETHTDPAELINSAVDALVRHRFELPTLDALSRLAATVNSKVNAAQWRRIGVCLNDTARAALESLLVVYPSTQESPFALICRSPGRASRKNLETLMDRYHWLEQLPEPSRALQSVADAKVLQWANEARRLNPTSRIRARF